MRLRDPTEAVATKTFYKSFYNSKPVEDDHAYGKPLNPGTPIKELLSNFFGEMGQHMTKSRYQQIHLMKRSGSRLNCHQRHTRASAMAKDYINGDKTTAES